MVAIPYVLLGLVTIGISILVVFRTETMLNFRSPGDIRQESIPDWKLWVWRGIGVTVALLSLGVIYIGLVVL